MHAVNVDPIEWAMITGPHPIYHFRNRQIRVLSQNCHEVVAILKDDGPGFEERGNPNIPVRFYVYNDRPDLGWSWLGPELYAYVQHVIKAKKNGSQN